MKHAREGIFERLRAAAPETRLPSTVKRETPRAHPAVLPEQCLERFLIEAAPLNIDCFVEKTAAEVRARIASLIDTQAVLAWDNSQLPYDAGDLLGEPARGDSARDVQAAAVTGLTGCDAAIAETATLALLSGPGRSRAASLLPALHVAIVPLDRLCFSMGDFFASHRQSLARAASCTFITGPSRTADIELTLTLGMHGPARLVVLFGPPDSST